MSTRMTWTQVMAIGLGLGVMIAALYGVLQAVAP